MRKSSKKGCTDHDGAGACFFGDAGLFGIDDVHCTVNVVRSANKNGGGHKVLRRELPATGSPIRLTDDTALEHLSEPGLRNTGSESAAADGELVPDLEADQCAPLRRKWGGRTSCWPRQRCRWSGC